MVELWSKTRQKIPNFCFSILLPILLISSKEYAISGVNLSKNASYVKVKMSKEGKETKD